MALKQAAEPYDCTGKIGPLSSFLDAERRPEWPMYSFERPSAILWGTIARELRLRGWTERRIGDWLQSRSTRYALDGSLGDALEELAVAYAEKIA